MSRDYVVCRSALIETEHEARQYYEQRLAGAHDIACRGRSVVIVFPRGANHVYTESANATLVAGRIIRRHLRSGVYDERVFNLGRARLMDAILPVVKGFTVSIHGTNPRGPRNYLLHGPAMNDGRHLRVVLSPRRGSTVWICRSAYPVSAAVWRRTRSVKQVRFPP